MHMRTATLQDVAPHLGDFASGSSASSTFWMDTLQNFSVVRTIGAGSFGRVFLVRNVISGGFFAMKIMKKAKILQQHQLQHVKDERALLGAVDCPYVVKLERTFQDSINLYFLMEYVPGGELFTLLRQAGRLSKKDAIYYASEIVVAFDYLHSQGIAYRDLKPENLLIDRWGHVRLVDFGFAKRPKGDITYTMCGTPEYLAPEVITGTGHGCAVDWWSLGVLIYELMAGYSPFNAPEAMKIYEKVLQGRYDFPAHFDLETRDLISSLLVHDKTRRLGNMVRGAKDVMDHPFFRTVDWDELREWRSPSAEGHLFGLQPLGTTRPAMSVVDTLHDDHTPGGGPANSSDEDDSCTSLSDSSAGSTTIRAFSWPVRSLESHSFLSSTNTEAAPPTCQDDVEAHTSSNENPMPPSSSQQQYTKPTVPHLKKLALEEAHLLNHMFDLTLSPAESPHTDTSEEASGDRFGDNFIEEVELSLDDSPALPFEESEPEPHRFHFPKPSPLYEHTPPWIPHIDCLGDCKHFDEYPEDSDLYVPLHTEQCRYPCLVHPALPHVMAYDSQGRQLPPLPFTSHMHAPSNPTQHYYLAQPHHLDLFAGF